MTTTGGATTRLRALTLTLTERCNMRCGYCYVPKERGRTMAPETVDAAVDLLVDQGASGAKSSLFFFGGEPLLEAGLLRRAVDRYLSRAAEAGLVADLGVTTNGTLLDEDLAELCRGSSMRVAVSSDGDEGPAERRLRGGGDARGPISGRLPGILALEPEVEVTVRMTVTPANVSRLAANVRALAHAGARRIVYLPAYELRWDDDAVRAWGREHERLGTWLQGAFGAGARPPDLPVFRGVEERLLGVARPRRHCGAGKSLAAVTADGVLMPCYRFVFAEDAEDLALGHVETGLCRPDALAVMAAIDPAALHPEKGDCASCSARDGCAHFCPALGHWMLRDLSGVPEVVCRLTRAQVEAIRPFAALARPSAPGRRRWPGWARAAAIAAAVASVGAAGCGRGGGGDDDADVEQGGLCPYQTDADADADADEPMGGVCPYQADADADADEPMGGLCPVQYDADVDADADEPMGGLCPVEVDADIDDDADVPMGGVCPFPVDADDGIPPGLC